MSNQKLHCINWKTPLISVSLVIDQFGLPTLLEIIDVGQERGRDIKISIRIEQNYLNSHKNIETCISTIYIYMWCVNMNNIHFGQRSRTSIKDLKVNHAIFDDQHLIWGSSFALRYDQINHVQKMRSLEMEMIPTTVLHASIAKR